MFSLAVFSLVSLPRVVHADKCLVKHIDHCQLPCRDKSLFVRINQALLILLSLIVLPLEGRSSEGKTDFTDLLIAPKVALGRQHDGGSLLLVDVRRNSSHSTIQSALKIPLTQIGSKAFLKNKYLVLVGEGYRLAEYVKVCSELREKGFLQAWVMVGGVNGWISAGGRVHGKVGKALQMGQRDFDTYG
jgi:rhodanese-related sulfurtransferase